MNRIPELYMESVYEVVFVSNTPAYLFKHLRRVLVDVAKTIPLETAASELLKELKSSSNDIYEAARAYAWFIVMTYKPYDDVRQYLDLIRSSSIGWINYLTRYYENGVVPSRSIEIDIPHLLVSDKPSALSGASPEVTTKEIDF